VDDTWADGTRTNENLPTQSAWFSNSSNSNSPIIVFPGMLVLSNATSTSRYFWTYFTSNSPDFNLTNGYPVEVPYDHVIKVKLTFIPSNVVAVGPQSLRIGLMDCETNQLGRINDDTNTMSSNGTGMTGYRATVFMMQTFTNDSPLGLRVRTNVWGLDPVDANASDPLGKDSVWGSLGSGPGNMSNQPGFQSGSTYTFEMDIARFVGSNIVTAAFYGSGLALTNVQTDDLGYDYFRFDTLLIRDNRAQETCDLINCTEFKVEVTLINPVVPFNITSVQRLSADSMSITWDSVSGATYNVLSTTSLSSPLVWSTNATVVASGPSTTYTATGNTGVVKKFYRVQAPPQ